jgi:uncharacterized protein with NRDE domain
MCLLAIFYRAVEDAHLVVGANREEFYDRPGEPPQIFDGPCRAVAGRDPLQGGTWLGMNERGVVAAVTNRRRSELPAAPRSRGLLTRDLLGCPSAAVALELAVRELETKCYAGCNVFIADRERALVLHHGDWLRVRVLPPGLHVLTNHDVNDASDRRLGHALWWLSQRNCMTSTECLKALQELCGQRGGDDPPICLCGPEKGTVSSSLLAVQSSLVRSKYLHAQGPPDRTPYVDYSQLLASLVRSP